MNKIKPCPFCGSEAGYWLDRQYDDCHVIECHDCCVSKRSEYYEDVFKEWNTRCDDNGKLSDKEILERVMNKIDNMEITTLTNMLTQAYKDGIVGKFMEELNGANSENSPNI